jgi:hypothetical protein
MLSNPDQKKWLKRLPKPYRFRLIAVMIIELLLAGAAGILLAVKKGGLSLPPIGLAAFSLIGGTQLVLAAYFFIQSFSGPKPPLHPDLQNQHGKAWAALILCVLWYGFGGLFIAFLLRNFFGWDHLPMGFAILAAGQLIPLGDAFRKPIFILASGGILLLSILILITLDQETVLRAQFLGIWINILLWKISLDQLRFLNQ